MNTEAVQPVDLKSCFSFKLIDPKISLDIITHTEDYETPSDKQVQAFIDEGFQESKEIVTIEKVDEILDKELRRIMRNKNSTTAMQYYKFPYDFRSKQSEADYWQKSESCSVACFVRSETKIIEETFRIWLKVIQTWFEQGYRVIS